MNWFYAVGEQQVGPLTEGDFDKLVQAGTVTPETMVWREDMTAWKPYGEVGSGAIAGAGAACSQCGTPTPADELIYLEGRPVCANCKPLVLQKIKEGVAITGQHVYGGFWIRVAAKFLDGILMWIMMILVTLLLGLVGGLFGIAKPAAGGAPNPAAMILGFVYMLVAITLAVGYIVFFVGKFGATPGKMACGLKIIRPDGSPMTYGRAFGRWAAEIVSGLTFYIGFLMVAFDDEKRGLHDRIADTRVVRK
jgi:uncharacterized RDD family membrane protein YckC